jgi:hypothetical protein
MNQNTNQKPLVNKSANNSNNQKPIKEFRSGAMTISIWKNESVNEKNETYEYNSVQFKKQYLDTKDNQWKPTNSLRINDLPKLSALLDEAYKFLVVNVRDDSNAESQE